MTFRDHPRLWAAVWALAAAIAVSCSYDAPDHVIAPSPIALVPATVTLQVLQTDAQTIIRADVRALDRQPVPAATVRFSSSIGTISPAEMLADAAGVARATWSGIGEAVITATAGQANASTSVSRSLKPLEVQLSVTPLVRYVPGTFTARTFDLIEPATYSWSFGDGASTVTTVNSTIHAYRTDDARLASVTVSDAGGRTGTATVGLSIAQPPPTPTTPTNPLPTAPALGATLNCVPGSTGVTPVATTCNVQSLTYGGAALPASAVTGMMVDWGDGSATVPGGPTPAVASYTYAVHGTYTVFATVTATTVDGARFVTVSKAVIVP